MAGYPTDYTEILRMMRNTLLDVQVARDIIRKAGLIPGDTGSAGGAGNDLAGRFAFRDQVGTSEDYGLATYGVRTIVPYDAEQVMPAGSHRLQKTPLPNDIAVVIEQTGYYRVHASMFVVIVETDIPWVTQIFASARGADFALHNDVLLDEQYFASEPRDTPDPFTGAWDGTNSPYMHGQNVIALEAGEVLTIDLLVSFLGDPTASEYYVDGKARVQTSYFFYRQWIELLNP